MANTQRDVTLAIRARDETQRAVNSAKTALDRFRQAQERTAARRDFLANSRKSAQDAAHAYIDAATAAQELGRKTQGGAAGTKKQKQAFDEARRAAIEAKKAFHDAGVAYVQAIGRAGTGRGSFATFDAVARGEATTAATTQRIAATQRQAAAATQQHAQAASRLESALEAEARLAREVDAAQASLWAAQRQGSASTEELTRAKVRLADAQQRLAAASRQVIAMQAAENAANGGAGDLAQRTANAYGSRNGRGPLGLRPYELTNLGYQVNDLITQVASGTSPVQALAQQGGQIIQLFPRAAAAVFRMVPAIAAVTAVVAPLIGAFNRLSGIESNIKKFDAALTATADSGAYTAGELAKAARALDDMGASGDDARKMVQQFVKDGLNPAYFEAFGDAARDLAKITGQDLVDANKLLSEGLSGTYDDFKALDGVLNVATASERRRIKELFESGRAEDARRMAAELTFKKLDEGAKKLDGPWSRAAANFGRAWTNLLTSVGNWPIIQGAIDLIGALGRKLEWLTRLMAGGVEIQQNAESIAGGRARIAEIDKELEANERNPNEGQRHFRRNRLLRERVRLGTDVATNENALRNRTLADVTLETERSAKEAEDRVRPSRTGSSGVSEAERLAEAQREYVAGLAAEAAERKFLLSIMDETERQQKILTAIREAELGAAEVGLTLTAQQREEIERTVGALYDAEQALKASETIQRALLDLARARGEQETRTAFVARRVAEDTEGWLFAQKVAYAGLLAAQWDADEATRNRQDAEKKVNDLLSIRQGLMEQITFYEDAGEYGKADGLRVRLEAVNQELALAVDNAINLMSLLGGAEAESTLLKLGAIRDELAGIGQNVVVTGKQINDSIAQGGAQAFDRFAQQLVETGNLFTSLRDAFLQFAADFLRQIAQMIVQQIILNAISGMFGGGGGSAAGLGGKMAGFVNAIVKHEGGSTSTGPRRMVPLSAFANAPRFHTGGIVPGEVPAILKRGEIVDPGDGSIFNKVFGGGKQAQSVKVLNVFDPADALDKALGSDEGERIFMNFVRKNSGAFKAVLG